MTSYYSIDRANERLPEVAEALEVLRDQRRELVRLRDRYVELTGRPMNAPDPAPEATSHGPERGAEEATTITGLEEARLVSLRVRGIVDQMGASVARLDAWDLVLRDIETGLVDFPALVAGRPVWLCWRLGEPQVIAWWHEHDAGVAGRRPIEEIG